MTTAHVEKFAELVGKDPALLAKLGLDKVNADAAAAAASAAAASASADAFIENAVKEAKALGMEFTDEEAREFMDANATRAARGELTDTQLEAVAGGKDIRLPVFNWTPKPVPPGREDREEFVLFDKERMVTQPYPRR